MQRDIQTTILKTKLHEQTNGKVHRRHVSMKKVFTSTIGTPLSLYDICIIY